MSTPKAPTVGSRWRFASLVDETPEEIAANRFVVTAVDLEGGLVSLRHVKPGADEESRTLNDFLVLFEPLA